mmetsp:Transcript_61965/g.110164  ORF Transcript_61965/g.110164 Transcript_61965/m.110164 type:complete len:204 (-) Transcript_61965:817-1428(-)
MSVEGWSARTIISTRDNTGLLLFPAKGVEARSHLAAATATTAHLEPVGLLKSPLIASDRRLPSLHELPEFLLFAERSHTAQPLLVPWQHAEILTERSGIKIRNMLQCHDLVAKVKSSRTVPPQFSEDCWTDACRHLRRLLLHCLHNVVQGAKFPQEISSFLFANFWHTRYFICCISNQGKEVSHLVRLNAPYLPDAACVGRGT